MPHTYGASSCAHFRDFLWNCFGKEFHTRFCYICFPFFLVRRNQEGKQPLCASVPQRASPEFSVDFACTSAYIPTNTTDVQVSIAICLSARVFLIVAMQSSLTFKFSR